MLACQRQRFSLPEGLHYLNCAYMSPLPRSVEAAGVAGVLLKRDPTTISPEDFFTHGDAVRRAFARLIALDDPTRVALVPAVSYALAIVARNLPLRRGQAIVLAEAQFPSNVYVWRRLAEARGARIVTVGPADGGRRGESWNARILEAIGPETGLVALPHVHWADGTRFDLVRIGARAREVGAALVVDGTQSVGALPFDLHAVRPDALVCAGYKWLLGPYGMGAAYFAPRFDGGEPIEENWINRLGSEDFAGLVNYRDEYQPGALRFDVGERSNPILLPMLAAALDELLGWGVPDIQGYCRGLTEGLLAELAERGFGVEAEGWRAAHLFGIRMPAGVAAEQVRARLAERRVAVSVRGDVLRVSPHVYNDEHDVAALRDALLAAADGGR